MIQKVCRFLSEIGSFESLRSCSQWSVHRKIEAKMSLTRAKERATSACRCRRVSVSVQRYGVQYKGVQPDRGHHCGRRHSERYDSTGLFTVTYQLIYRHCTCTVQGCWSTSD
jgi:hypothetical protein